MVKFPCCLYIERFSDDGNGIKHFLRCRHLNLPFACLAIGGHKVGPGSFNGGKQVVTDGLRLLIVIALEALCAGNAAAVRGEHLQLHTGYHLHQ